MNPAKAWLDLSSLEYLRGKPKKLRVELFLQTPWPLMSNRKDFGKTPVPDAVIKETLRVGNVVVAGQGNGFLYKTKKGYPRVLQLEYKRPETSREVAYAQSRLNQGKEPIWSKRG
jgi:hypothetical protein